MIFGHDEEIRREFPRLRGAVVEIAQVDDLGDTSALVRSLLHDAQASLEGRAESELAPIKAWRSVYAQMGYKPTQYRCASESLLRRLRQSGDLPSLHPLVDLCNAVSAAWAVPVAAFDLEHVSGELTVRRADGTEEYHAFDGAVEQPEAGEVIFRDEGAQAHSRRWAYRQSALSAISPRTTRALVVIEGHHDDAASDTGAAADALIDALRSVGSSAVSNGVALSPHSPSVEIADA